MKKKELAGWKRNSSKPFSLLTSAVILHLFSLVCSVYRDTYRWLNVYWAANYWLNFFAWWCTQTSLVTILYFLYRIFKPTTVSFWSQVFEVVVVNANLIAVSMFTMGVVTGNLALPSSREMVNLFGWKVSSRAFWWFYSLIWHYLAPFLTLCYFASQQTDLGKTYRLRRKLFLASFFHPLIYFGIVLFRPLIPGSQAYPFSKQLPHYPYFFFEWAGWRGAEPLFWTLVVVLFWMLIFWAAFLFFWKFTNQKI